jgi:hypothetical protein
MAENDGLSAAPVLEIDLRAVFGRDRVHSLFSFSAVEAERFACLLSSLIDGQTLLQQIDHRTSAGTGYFMKLRTSCEI